MLSHFFQMWPKSIHNISSLKIPRQGFREMFRRNLKVEVGVLGRGEGVGASTTLAEKFAVAEK